MSVSHTACPLSMDFRTGTKKPHGRGACAPLVSGRQTRPSRCGDDDNSLSPLIRDCQEDQPDPPPGWRHQPMPAPHGGSRFRFPFSWGNQGNPGNHLVPRGVRGSPVVPSVWTGGTWPVADQNLANSPQAVPGAPARWSCAGCPQGCPRGWWITEYAIVSHCHPKSPPTWP